MIVVNQKAIRRLALDLAQKRAHKFTRVSQDFVNRIDASVKMLVLREVEALPSKGRTIK